MKKIKDKIPVKVCWRNDTNKILKGKWVNETRPVGRQAKEATIKVWKPDYVWVVWYGVSYDFTHNKLVEKDWLFLTYWIPDQKRFCFLSPGEEKGFKLWAEGKPLTSEEAPPKLPEENDE